MKKCQNKIFDTKEYKRFLILPVYLFNEEGFLLHNQKNFDSPHYGCPCVVT